jgi:hypothetical protein
MKPTAIVPGALVAALLAGIAGAADEGSVYVWKDKDGTPHYQDRPPEGDPAAAQEMSLRYRLTDAEAVAAAGRKSAEEKAETDKQDQVRSEDEAAAKAEKDKLMSEREKGCASARERLAQYDTAHRLYRPGPDGERIYLTDEEIDRARADASRTVADWCGE